MIKVMHTFRALLRFVVVGYWVILLIFLRFTSLAPGQSYDCPGAREAILKNLGKSNKNDKQNKAHQCHLNSYQIYCMIHMAIVDIERSLSNTDPPETMHDGRHYLRMQDVSVELIRHGPYGLPRVVSGHGSRNRVVKHISIYHISLCTL